MADPIAKSSPAITSGERCCGRCVHFQNDPAALEAAFKGLSSLSSGYASVKSHDGVCDRHGIYLSFYDTCADFKD